MPDDLSDKLDKITERLDEADEAEDEKRARKPIDWTTVLLAVIALVGTIMAPVTTYYVSQIHANTTETVKIDKEIHTAVNSNYKDMTDKLMEQRDILRAQNQKILELSVGKAQAEERSTTTVRGPPDAVPPPTDPSADADHPPASITLTTEPGGAPIYTKPPEEKE